MREFANLRAVPFRGAPPKGNVMRLPNTAPIKTPGPAGFMLWLRRESAPGGLFPGVFQHVRSRAPHLITQAALHGFGQDGPVALDPSQLEPIGIDTGVPGYTAPFDTSSYTLPDITPAADPSLPGGSSGGWADSLAQMVTPIVTAAEQIKLFNTQLSLAQQGKPPLNTSQMRLPTIPVGISFGAGGNTGLLIGGAVLVGALLLFGGRRRT